MKKTIKAIILSLCILMGCSKDDVPDLFIIEGITMENYPKVDCSTFTNLINGEIDLIVISRGISSLIGNYDIHIKRFQLL